MRARHGISTRQWTAKGALVALVASLAAVGPGHATEPERPVSTDASSARPVAARPAVDFRAVLVAVKTRPPAVARSVRDETAANLSAEQLALVDALLLAREGDAEAAEEALRALLTEDPSRRLVRFELAQLLIRRERYTAARFQLDLLTASEPDPDVRRVYTALDRRISDLRPWDVDVSFGIAPRTNANRGSTEETIGGPGGRGTITSRAVAGVGATYSASAARRFAVTPTIDLYARGFASGIEYEDRDLASNRVGVGAFARYNAPTGGRFDLGLDLARDYADGNVLDGVASANVVTPYVSFHRPLSRRFALGGSQRLSFVDYETALPDGWRGSTAGTLSFAPQAGRVFSGSLTYGFDRSGQPFNQYDSLEVGLSAYAELPLGVSATLRGAVGARDFRSQFPTLAPGKTREDSYARVSLDLTKRDWAVRGFAPRVGLSYEINESNVPLYTFDDVGVRLGVSRSF